MISEYKEEILFDGNYLESLLTEIRKARYSIDMEVYIFAADAAGQLVADALCNAAKRGIKIRVLVDGIGSISWGGKMTSQMESNGILTKVFHPLPWKLSHWNRSNSIVKLILPKIMNLAAKINSRNHRKICIIDKSIVYIGSANVNNHLIGIDSADIKWRETTAKLTGVNTDDIQFAFDKAWGNITLMNRLNKTLRKASKNSVFQLNYSWRLRRQYYISLLNKIANSNQQIWVTNAYFVPDSHLLNKLITASQKGVDVRIILPGKSDIPIMSLAASRFYYILLKNGVSIYEYLPTVLHAKTLIIDNWCSVGSSNLNYRSFKHDLEVNAVIHTDKAKDIVYKQFIFDLEQSRQLEMSDIINQSFLKKIAASLVLLFRYWI